MYAIIFTYACIRGCACAHIQDVLPLPIDASDIVGLIKKNSKNYGVVSIKFKESFFLILKKRKECVERERERERERKREIKVSGISCLSAFYLNEKI